MLALIDLCISQHYAVHRVTKSQSDSKLHQCLQWFDRKVMSFFLMCIQFCLKILNYYMLADWHISRTSIVPIKTESGTTNCVYFSNTSGIMTSVLKRNKPQGTVKYLCFSKQSKALSSKSRKMKDNQAPAKCFPLRDVITKRWAYPRFLVLTVRWHHEPVIFLTENDNKLLCLSPIAWSSFVRFSLAEQHFSANRAAAALLFEQREDCLPH